MWDADATMTNDFWPYSEALRLRLDTDGKACAAACPGGLARSKTLWEACSHACREPPGPADGELVELADRCIKSNAFSVRKPLMIDGTWK
jgi:hypothetical protein